MSGVPPNDPEAERAVLGAVLMAPEQVPELAGWLKAEDFYDTRHAAVFGAVLGLHADLSRPDPVTVFSRIGNPDLAAFLAHLVKDVPSEAGLMDYARRVKDRSTARGVVAASHALLGLASEPSVSGPDLVAEARRRIDAIEDGAEAAFAGISEIADDAIAACENPGTGTVGTGLSTLDAEAGIFRAGQLVLVGARPGAGKTALATRMAVHAGKQGVRAVLATYEMHPTDLWVRMACAESGLPMQEILAGRHLDALKDARGALDSLPVTIAHAPRMSLARLFAGCRRVRAGVVLVDYLQLVPMPAAETRERQVAEASRQCKLAAQELGVPVVVCVQLNRGVEHRGPEAKPRLSDLRESGALEQDADVVLLLDREELRRSQDPNVRTGVVDVFVAKNRNGPAGGRVTLGWHGPTMRLYDAT